MKKLIYTISIFTLSLLFMGCPYKTKVNLEDKPNEKVNSSYLGSYEKKGSTTYKYIIKQKEDDANKYRIEEIKNYDDSLYQAYEGYTTTIKGTQFLITNKISSYSTTNIDYYIYKLEANSSGTIMKLYELTDNITEEFETPKALKEFIAKHKDLGFFYNKNITKTNNSPFQLKLKDPKYYLMFRVFFF
jgi:hypothetical protein